jgi:hypothetical protein
MVTDDDPNEAYEVVPIEPGPHGPPHTVDRQAEGHPSAILSRQGKGRAIRDRSGISGEPRHRESVGEGEGEVIWRHVRSGS